MVICVDHNWRVRILSEHALDVCAYTSNIDHSGAHPDLIRLGNCDENTLILRVLLGSVWSTDIESMFLDKGRGDYEKDEHDEDDVEHRSQIDSILVYRPVASNS